MSPTLIAVGALNVDLVFRLTGPPAARASNVATLARRTGGVAANVARAFAAERARGSAPGSGDGPAPLLVCAVGDDSPSRLDGVELLGVVRPGAAGGTYAAVLDDAGELHLGLAATGVTETLTAAEAIDRTHGREALAWLLDANLSADCLAGLAHRSAADGRAPLVAMAVSPEKALRLAPLARRVDCLFCNRREAIALTNAAADAPIRALADALASCGWRRTVLTDGPGPLVVTEPAGSVALEVPPSPGRAEGAGGTDGAVKGTVNGAGDALAGATLVHWLAGSALADAVARAGLPAAARHLARPDDPTR